MQYIEKLQTPSKDRINVSKLINLTKNLARMQKTEEV